MSIKVLRAQLKKLDKQISKLRQQYWKKQEEIDKLQEPEYAKLVGKCFVYQNTYGSGYGKPWPLYTKILSYKDGGYTVLNVQKDCDGKISIEMGHWCKEHIEDNKEAYKLVDEGDFQLALDLMVNDLEALGVNVRDD